LSEELQNALSEALAKATSAVDFVVAETPEVIQQLLLWRMASSICYCALALVVATSIGIAWVKGAQAVKSMFKDDSCKDQAYMFFTFIGLLLSVLASIPIFCCMNLDWLQIWLAPKVYLIEYAADSVK
jgi:hypothetical protein